MKDLVLYRGVTIITGVDDDETFYNNLIDTIDKTSYSNNSYCLDLITDTTEETVEEVNEAIAEKVDGDFKKYIFVVYSNINADAQTVKDIIHIQEETLINDNLDPYILIISSDDTIKDAERVIDVSDLVDNYSLVINI